MKRVTIIMVGLLMAVMSYSQNNAAWYSAAYDTLTGDDTASMQYPQPILTPYGYAIQHASVKIAGTGASTVSYIQGSLDGSNWVDLDTIQTIANASGYATATSVTGLLYPYLRVYALQTGTAETTKQKTYFQIYPEVELFYFPAPAVYTVIDAETLTNTDTYSGVYPRSLNGVYAYSYQITGTETSGTATNTVTVQTSNDNTNWTTLQTYTISTDTTILGQSVTGDLGKYMRIYVSQAGTGVNVIYGYVKLYLRKF